MLIVSSRPKWPFGDRPRRSLNAVQICRAALLAKIMSGLVTFFPHLILFQFLEELFVGRGLLLEKWGPKSVHIPEEMAVDKQWDPLMDVFASMHMITGC